MGKKVISFVILYYKAFEVTTKCVDSICELECPADYKISIIIVDNNSPDNGFLKLQSLYEKYSYITLIHNNSNEGFARGNNIGFLYAKKNISSDYIILTNSDTFILDKRFVNKLVDDYEKESFDIAGPDIVSLIDGKHQNPEKRQYYSKNDILKRIKKLKLLNLLCKIHTDIFVQNVYRLICGNISSDGCENDKLSEKDFQLFGAFLIFSKNYINNYDGLYSKTFMYGEENILRYIIDRDFLKMTYLSDLQVFHAEESSTNAEFGGNLACAQRQFRYKNSINSCYALLKLIQSDENATYLK